MNELKTICVSVLGKLTANGADRAKCTVSRGRKDEFNIDGGRFSLFRTTFDSALNMSAIKDMKRGVVASNRLDPAAVDAAVAECMENAAMADADPAWDIAPLAENKDFTVGCPVADTDKLFARTEEFLAAVKREFSLIMLEQVIVSHDSVEKVVMNTNGVEYTVNAGSYSISVMYSAHDGDKCSSFAGAEITTADLDKPFLELGSVRRDFDEVSRQIETRPVDGKFVGVMVLKPDCLGDFLYMLFENTVDDFVLLNGTSLWKDKLGQSVADSRISVSMAPYDDRIVAGERITADGFEAKDFAVIEKGVLKSFTLSLYAANKLGLERAANSSMNVVVDAGDKPLDELIAGIDRGIYVGRFSGGQPSANGEFSGVAKNSFLIENGKLTDAVSETMINGSLTAMLNDLYGISSEISVSGASVLPYMAFNGITVSGK